MDTKASCESCVSAVTSSLATLAGICPTNVRGGGGHFRSDMDGAVPAMGRSGECIAYITRSLEHGCRLARLAALVASAGDRMVYVLHGRNHTPTGEAVAKLRPQKNVRLVRQPLVVPSSPWGLFGGKFVGYSKAAFVLWLLRSHTSCHRAWQIEDDVFFTGPWSALFNAYSADESHIIASTIHHPSTSYFAHERTCFLNITTRCRSAEDRSLTAVVWPLLRMSHAVASEIARALTTQRAKGFHEALLAPLCERAAWCSLSHLRPEHLGSMVAGHSSASKRKQSPVLARRAYHPAKCEADPGLGELARTWLQQNST